MTKILSQLLLLPKVVMPKFLLQNVQDQLIQKKLPPLQKKMNLLKMKKIKEIQSVTVFQVKLPVFWTIY